MLSEQLQWILDAGEPEKTFRAMVVGWQCVLDSLNATVLAFNQEFFERKVRARNRELAVKRLTVASLYEIKLRLDDWYHRMEGLGALSNATTAAKRNARNVWRPLERYAGIRHLSFHYGDPLEPADELVRLYSEIETLNLEGLNNILRELVQVGELLKADALGRTG